MDDFEKKALVISKMLTTEYNLPNAKLLENNILKYSPVKGGIVYDLDGNTIKKFGIYPNISPAYFKNIPAINNEFYIKDKNHVYMLWDPTDLQQPFNMVVVLDSSGIKHILLQFIKTYWEIAILLLFTLSITSLFISYFLLLDPIRKAYQSLQLTNKNFIQEIPQIHYLPRNELGFIFNVINSTFIDLQLSLKNLDKSQKALNHFNQTLEATIKQRTKELENANKELFAMASLPEQNQNPTFRVSANGTILYANKASDFIFHFWNCENTNTLPAQWIDILNSVLKSNVYKQMEVLIDGKVFLFELLPITAENYVNIYAVDISERKRIEQENRFLQSHNPLTKIFNRHFFTLLIDEKKTKSECFSLMLIHINDYISINQHLGQTVANKFLQHSAETLKNSIHSDDLLGHFSHHLFAIATFHCNTITAIDNFAQHLISVFSQAFVIDNFPLHTSINIGIALYPADQKDIELLIQYADMALLQAHNAGVNTFKFYTAEINHQLLKQHQLYQDLHQAVLSKQLSLVYQPQLSLHTNTLIGAETLIRWHHPEKGLIPPDEFIAILENSSLIFLITEWLFETSAKIYNKLKKQKNQAIHLAINLTSKQLHQEDLLNILTNIIHKFSIDPKYFEIEITERVSLTNPEKCIAILQAIRQLGFIITIDDFGSDYSSLKYLQKLPIDTIKIDKSFIENLESEQEDQKIVKTIIQLAKELNLTVLAEGIETVGQMKILRMLGCDHIQGYLVSKPLEEEPFLQFCKNPNIILY